MIVLRNMDELMTLDMPDDHIAAAHVCACNPRGIEHYPNDWFALLHIVLDLSFIIYL